MTGEGGKWRQCVNMGPCSAPYCEACSRCIRHYAEQRNDARYGSIDFPGIAPTGRR